MSDYNNIIEYITKELEDQKLTKDLVTQVVADALNEYPSVTPTSVDEEGRGLLFYAARLGKTEVLHILYENGFKDVNARDLEKKTILHAFFEEASFFTGRKADELRTLKWFAAVGVDFSALDQFAQSCVFGIHRAATFGTNTIEQHKHFESLPEDEKKASALSLIRLVDQTMMWGANMFCQNKAGQFFSDVRHTHWDDAVQTYFTKYTKMFEGLSRFEKTSAVSQEDKTVSFKENIEKMRETSKRNEPVVSNEATRLKV